MSTTFNSPCTDHDNCPLDLKKLKEAIKHGTDPKSYERFSVAEAHYLKLVQAKAPEPAINSAKADLDKASKLYYESVSEQSAEGKTILYSMRAHHRGRLHRQKTRNPDGSLTQHTLETQGEFLSSPGAQRLLKKFLKAVTSTPTQAA